MNEEDFSTGVQAYPDSGPHSCVHSCKTPTLMHLADTFRYTFYQYALFHVLCTLAYPCLSIAI